MFFYQNIMSVRRCGYVIRPALDNVGVHRTHKEQRTQDVRAMSVF